ncbi:MAG: mechanosensitive ion channel [SAR324 cluster bacterium]|nr:mechanosensitive ion channel [SAR324 cluster bacterium]
MWLEIINLIIENFTTIYLIIVGFTGALLIWISRRKILQFQSKKSARIEKIEDFESIQTSSPVDDSKQETKDAAVESIEQRFTIIRKISFYSIVFVWFSALSFPFLGQIPATLVSLLVAASGVIVGVAARPLIENLISGVVISFSKLIRIGDTVLIDGKYGTIEDISITHTIIKIWDWQRYIIPNSLMLEKDFFNQTVNDQYLWAHVKFNVAYDNDLELVRKLAIASAAKSKYFSNNETPSFWVMEMNEKAYQCWVAAWADSPMDAWELKHEIRTELIIQFKAHGIKTHSFEINSSSFVENITASA